MKLKRFEHILNESKIDTSTLTNWSIRTKEITDTYLDKSRDVMKEMLKTLEALIPKSGNKINFNDSNFTMDAQMVYYGEDEIVEIGNERGTIGVSVGGENIQDFIHMDINDALNLMYLVNDYYDYQKEIIEDGDPENIKDILDKLHPKIKKEYPHLLTGTDLNLL